MKQLDPKAFWIFFISYAFRWLFFVIILSVMFGPFFMIGETQGQSMISFNFLNWIWLLIPLVIVGSYVWAKLTYKYYMYELTENGFRKESGVIYKKYVTIPYDIIQNVDIYRGILARMLGLSDLNIQTAGASMVINRYGAMGGGAEGRLPAVSKEEAEIIRDELIRRTRLNKTQGL